MKRHVTSLSFFAFSVPLRFGPAILVFFFCLLMSTCVSISASRGCRYAMSHAIQPGQARVPLLERTLLLHAIEQNKSSEKENYGIFIPNHGPHASLEKCVGPQAQWLAEKNAPEKKTRTRRVPGGSITPTRPLPSSPRSSRGPACSCGRSRHATAPSIHPLGPSLLGICRVAA